MTDVERRFQTSMREIDTDEPGLVLEDDGTIWQVAPGGARTQIGSAQPVIARERFTDQVVANVPYDGSPYLLSWGASAGPDGLLDVSDPMQPKAVESGVYAVSVGVSSGSLTPGTVFGLSLDMDFEGDIAEQQARSAPATPDAPQVRASATITYYVPAGHSVRVYVTNYDSGATRPFKIEDASVQRLS